MRTTKIKAAYNTNDKHRQYSSLIDTRTQAASLPPLGQIRHYPFLILTIDEANEGHIFCDMARFGGSRDGAQAQHDISST